jgi:hypothetical protein
MPRLHSIIVCAAAAAAAILTATSPASGSPARLITSPPVLKGPNPLTGPPNDPLAAQGQWFLHNGAPSPQVRPWEFYDNNDQPGTTGYQAIRGQVANLTFGGASGANLTGFSIVATITNDLPGLNFPGQPGRNRHDEQLFTSPNFQGTMFDVKMTAEFAFPSFVNVPANVLNQIATNTLPYSAPSYGGQNAAIIAQNEDEEGWYCFTNGTGGFHVPTYDFGNIAPGQSVTRTLNFTIPAPGLLPSHPLYPQLLGWAANQSDVLMNRTTDLKIGDWVDVLAQDSGVPYPNPAFNSGNVSVFFNVPEPTSLAALLPAGLVALRRRKRATCAE